MRPPPPPAPEPDALAAVPVELARRAGVLPLALRAGVLHVGVAPRAADDDALEELRIRTGAVAVATVPVAAPLAALLVAHADRTLRAAWADPDGSEAAGSEASGSEASGPDAVAVLDAVLDAAVGRGASDVHLEPVATGLRVRLRRDGGLHELGVVRARLRDAIVARVKVRADLDVAERRAPQDGRLTHPTPTGPVDVRVATLPARRGERVTLRLLPRDAVADLEGLGLPDAVGRALVAAAGAADGLVLVCGPTGSGKTTTLHAVLGRIARAGRAVMTLEDPVEREVPGTSQTQVDSAAGLGFATGLRHLLRHDPDVLLVGEIRDAETAALAVEAARTGHLVLTTLHAVDAPSALDRLADLGLPAARVLPVLRLVVAQRLLGLPCPACDGGSRGGASRGGADRGADRGCRDCDGTGTRGRTAVAEALACDAALRTAVLGATDAATARAALHAACRPRLREVALARAAEGRARALDAVASTPEPRA